MKKSKEENPPVPSLGPEPPAPLDDPEQQEDRPAEVIVHPVRMLPIDSIEPDPENPNIEDIPTFNELVDGIRRFGFTEPVTVAAVGEDRYVIISGEHRWKAGKLLGLREIPAVVQIDATEDERHIQMVRMNLIRGKLDPDKFTKMYTNLRKRYDPEHLKRQLGFASKEAELSRLLKTVTKGLPSGAAEEIRKRAEKIKSVEDLAVVVQSIFAKYGNTLKDNFIVFSLAGREQLMVRCTSKTFMAIAGFAQKCHERAVPFDITLARIAEEDYRYVEVLDQLQRELDALDQKEKAKLIGADETAERMAFFGAEEPVGDAAEG